MQLVVHLLRTHEHTGAHTDTQGHARAHRGTQGNTRGKRIPTNPQREITTKERTAHTTHTAHTAHTAHTVHTANTAHTAHTSEANLFHNKTTAQKQQHR